MNEKLRNQPAIEAMDPFLYTIGIALFISALLILFSKLLIKTQPKNLPPSPPSLPIIGHLHHLQPPLHLAMTRLAKRYGPVVFLRLGSRPVLIVSSASAAEESLKDPIFANHLNILAGEYLDSGNSGLFFAPYGPHWSKLRKIASLELLSTKKVEELASFRAEELRRLIRRLADCAGSDGRGVVSLKPKIIEMVYGAMLGALTGKRYSGEDPMTSAEEAKRFKEMVDETVHLVLEFNPGDFFPVLKHFDLRGLTRRMIKLKKKHDEFMKKLFDDHRNAKQATAQGKTLIDVLLSMQESDPNYCTDKIIRGLILPLTFGGTDTMCEIIESAMLLLLCHPEVVKKIRAEMDVHVEQGRLLAESDLPKLTYLRCVVQETLRLCPHLQGMPPHQSSADCTVQGFHVPRGTMLFVNVWAIQRDPELWDDPLSFKPERFAANSGCGSWKEGYNFFPFGWGRRKCPGEGLGMRMVPLVVGALIQCFDWETVGEEEVDLSAVLGLSKPKEKHFMPAFRPRDSMITAV